MKTIKFLSLLLTAVFLAATTTTTFAADAPGEQCKEGTLPKVINADESTLSFIMSNKNCSIFAKAIHDSGLEEMLGNAAACTLFAPDDSAFDKWSKADMDALFKCPAALSVLVLNHVCPSVLSPEDLKAKMEKHCEITKNECLKIFGKENADKCEQFCKQMKKLKWSKKCIGDEETRPDTDGNAAVVKTCPSSITKCNNGYVYVIGKVQVPRGLKVYKELKAAQNSPVVLVETVEFAADVQAVPVTPDSPDETTPPATTPPMEPGPAEPGPTTPAAPPVSQSSNE